MGSLKYKIYIYKKYFSISEKHLILMTFGRFDDLSGL